MAHQACNFIVVTLHICFQRLAEQSRPMSAVSVIAFFLLEVSRSSPCSEYQLWWSTDVV